MSYQALAWAIDQDVESPSARCVLMSIANYANEDWCAWPKQDLIAKEGVQSVDSVQRRMPDLIARALVRRIKLKRFGRRTHDFYILKRSPYFDAELEAIRPLLPSGCDVIEDTEPPAEAAASCGSDKNDSPAPDAENQASRAAADCGNAEPATLPQSAVHAAAMVRQPKDEPVRNQDSPPAPPAGGSRAQKLLDEFRGAWTEPMARPSLVDKVFLELPDARQEQAPQAAKGYFAWLASQGTRAPTAMSPQTFLREPTAFEKWIGYAKPGALPLISQAFAGDSAEAKSIELIYALAGKHSAFFTYLRLRDGTVHYRREITSQLLALASAPPKDAWPQLTRQQAAAWNDLIDAAVASETRNHLKEGDRAPWPWPPSKEGKTYTTGPPGVAA